MIIRPATIDDILVIHALANEIWWPAYKDVIPDEQISFMLQDIYSEQALLKRVNDKMEFLIAERAGIPVGFAEYSQTSSEILRIHKLYIVQSEHGKGTGRMFIDYIADQGRRHAANILELNVNRANKAFNFYIKQGFEIWQTVDIPYHSYILNDYVMRKSI